MSEYIADSAALTHTADRIRAKTGGTDPITWDAAKGFGDAVDEITGGGAVSYEELPPRDTSVDWDTFEGLYFIFNNNALPAGHPLRQMPCGFDTGTYGGDCKLEFGTMAGSTFVAKNETTAMTYTYGQCYIFDTKVPDYGDRFTIARVTPVTGRHLVRLWIYMLGKNENSTVLSTGFTVGVYGRAINMTSIRANGQNLQNCIIFDFPTADRGADEYGGNAYKSMRSVRALTNVNYVSTGTPVTGMFSGCSSLQTLDLSALNTESVTNMNNMFSGCSSLQTLDLSALNTESVTNMNNMFSGCSSLQTLDLSVFDTSKVTDMNQMFQNCSNMQVLNLSTFDTHAVTKMRQMFNSCGNLQTLNISSFDMSAVADQYQMFNACTSLQNFTSCVFYKSIAFNNSNNLTHDSLMSIINNLATVTSTQTLTIGTTNKAKLTDDEIAVATGKGWTVA